MHRQRIVTDWFTIGSKKASALWYNEKKESHPTDRPFKGRTPPSPSTDNNTTQIENARPDTRDATVFNYYRNSEVTKSHFKRENKIIYFPIRHYEFYTNKFHQDLLMGRIRNRYLKRTNLKMNIRTSINKLIIIFLITSCVRGVNILFRDRKLEWSSTSTTFPTNN